MDLESLDIVFSDFLKITRSDETRVRGGCALRHRICVIVGIACDSHVRAERVGEVIPTIGFESLIRSGIVITASKRG
jgi:hypothetical protein